MVNVFNFKELHIHLLQILYQSKEPVTPKHLISLFALNYITAYNPTYEGTEDKITNAKIYAAIKYLEKETLIEQHTPKTQTSKKTQPTYSITRKGLALVRQSIFLNVQYLLSLFTATFIRENAAKLSQLQFDDKYSKALIAPMAPFGQSVMAHFLDPDSLSVLKRASGESYFVDVDPVIEGSEKGLSTESILSLKTLINEPISTRRCYMDEEGKFRIDIGTNSLDVGVILMLFSTFPDKLDQIIDELGRVLSQRGQLIIQEIDIRSSIVTWLLQRLDIHEAEMLPPLFQKIAQNIRNASGVRIETIAERLKSRLGLEVHVESFQEIVLLHATRPL